jgi:hypothetical protein
MFPYYFGQHEGIVMNYDYSRPAIGTYKFALGDDWHEIEWCFLEDRGQFCSGYIYGSAKTIEALLYYRPWSINLYDSTTGCVRFFCSIDILIETSPGWLGWILGKIWPKFSKSRLYITYSEWPELLMAIAKKSIEQKEEKPIWQRMGF